ERFVEDQNYMIYLALKSPSNDVFDQEFLQLADETFEGVANLKGIDSLVSATRFPQIKRKGMSFSAKPYFEFEDQAGINRSRKRIEKDSSMVGLFITRNYEYLCAYTFIDTAIFDSRERDLLSEQLEQQLESSGLEYVISGIPYIRTRYVSVIGEELAIFASTSIFLIILVLALTYRNIWGVLIPMIAVLLALVWILGLMGATGQHINLISNLLIPIMFVVGTSDVIHLVTKYLTEIRAGESRILAIRTTLREIGIALFFTSLTTAIGFASLLVSKVPPIRVFGLYAAIGVLFTFVISIVFLPNALLRLPKEQFLKTAALENNPIWERWLQRLYDLTTTRKNLIAGTFAVVLVGCLFLIPVIPTDTYLIEDIGKNDPIRKSLEFFEDNSYGLRPFELGIRVKDSSKSIMDREILVELDKMERWLEDQGEFSPFLSPASLVRETNYLSRFSREQHRRIPDTQEEIDELVSLTQLNGGDALWDRVVTKDGKDGRISSRLPDIGTDAFEVLYARLDSFVIAESDTNLFSYRATGHAFLTEHNLKYIRSSLLAGLSIAFVVVGLLMGLLFRSWRMLLVSMLPNVIPLLLTGGVMALFGITLTASTALVFVISFGIAVDDTIHFLTRYRLEISQGHTVDEAIRQTILGTGKAMLITSLILMGGFIVLVISDFGGTWAVGMFTALTIVFALLADLLLLPILLRWVFQKERKAEGKL
ncbi:MAG: MMPL family transporter, partial [Bacteroidota bacterium]